MSRIMRQLLALGLTLGMNQAMAEDRIGGRVDFINPDNQEIGIKGTLYRVDSETRIPGLPGADAAGYLHNITVGMQVNGQLSKRDKGLLSELEIQPD